MANSRIPGLLGRDPHAPAARTPGPLGQRDAADPSAPGRLVGDTPGPLGVRDLAAKTTAAATPAAAQTARGKQSGGAASTPPWLASIGELVPALEGLLDLLGLGSGGSSSSEVPSWVSVAANEVGQKEDARKGKHNARIVEYQSASTLKAPDDETPWCSSFVNWVMKEAGYKGTDSALALSWKDWGDAIREPALGSVGVIDWGKQDEKKKGKGHVGLVVGRTAKGSIVLLGGNQSDSVSRSAFKQSLFVAFRVPKGFVVSKSAYALPEMKLEAGGFRETR